MESDTGDFLVVAEDEAGERLDKILAKRFSDAYSRTYFQYLMEEQLVLLNGVPIKKRVKPCAGDEVEIHFAVVPEAQLLPEAIPLTIIYEDDDLLAVDKPAGMVVHPAPGNWSGTLVHALLHHCVRLEGQMDSLRPGIVHRLDKDTSGVLVAAKTLAMQHKLMALFASRQIYKEYRAICVGCPADGEIRAPIGRHPIRRKEMAVLPSGREAVTFCKTIKGNGQLSLVRVVIATGRTHQIRVHLSSKGTPVLGDALYGSSSANRRYGIDRQFLHAAMIKFQHPLTGQTLELSAALPPDMQRFIQNFF